MGYSTDRILGKIDDEVDLIWSQMLHEHDDPTSITDKLYDLLEDDGYVNAYGRNASEDELYISIRMGIAFIYKAVPLTGFNYILKNHDIAAISITDAIILNRVKHDRLVMNETMKVVSTSLLSIVALSLSANNNNNNEDCLTQSISLLGFDGMIDPSMLEFSPNIAEEVH